MIPRLGSALIDLVVPLGCAGCAAHTAGRVLCPSCADELEGLPGWEPPGARPQADLPVASAGTYGGVLREVLLAHKEQGRLALVRPLGLALAGPVALAASLARDGPPTRTVAMVPVPSAARTTRRRGHEPLLRTCGVAAASLRSRGLAVRVVEALRVCRPVADQAGLDAAARAANLSHAFGVRPGAVPRLADRVVVLVDDVLTTGSTLAEANRALRSAGIRPVGAAVLAATRLRGRRGGLDAEPGTD